MEIRATSSGADLEKLTAKAVKALTAAQRVLGRDIAKAARRAILADVKSKRRGGLSFSGMKSKTGAGVRLGASTKVMPGTQLVVTVSAKPGGPWSIVEYGSKPHDIEPKTKRALFFSELFSDSVYHPGTSGHAYWAGAEGALDDAVTPIIVDAVGDIFEEAAA